MCQEICPQELNAGDDRVKCVMRVLSVVLANSGSRARVGAAGERPLLWKGWAGPGSELNGFCFSDSGCAQQPDEGFLDNRLCEVTLCDREAHTDDAVCGHLPSQCCIGNLETPAFGALI